MHRGWYSAHVVTDVLPLEASLLVEAVQALPRLQSLCIQLARVRTCTQSFPCTSACALLVLWLHFQKICWSLVSISQVSTQRTPDSMSEVLPRHN